MGVFPRIYIALMLFPSFLFADLLETVLHSQQLRVCIWPEYYGISYLNPRTQKLSGIDVDLAQEFASTLGVNVSFVQSSFATLIQDLLSHRCDIAMFAIGITPERQKYLRFTSPHLQSDIYAIVSKSNNRIQTWEDIDQEGVVVTVAKGTYHVKLMQNALRKASLHVVDSLRAREQEVESGRADVMMTTTLLARNCWSKKSGQNALHPPLLSIPLPTRGHWIKTKKLYTLVPRRLCKRLNATVVCKRSQSGTRLILSWL